MRQHLISLSDPPDSNPFMSPFNPTNYLRAVARRQYGCLSVEGIKRIACYEETRLTNVLVRTNRCRFTAPAQDVLRIASLVCNEQTGDWVRDYQLPAVLVEELQKEEM